MSRFIDKTEAKRLIKKLEMKYGSELEEINQRMQEDVKTYGFVQLETEAARDLLFARIKDEEKHYQ